MADTINFEITTSQPEVAATLEDLRYLVFEGMAGKAPRINTTNYHWEVYDNNTQSWVDTGISAVNGAPGQDGYTPTISVAQGTDGITVTISDGRPSGTTASYFIPNGQDYVLTNADKQEIADLLDDGVPTLVTDWLDDNVTPVGSAVVVDSSLSIAGAAADAAMVGAALQRIQLPDEVKQTLLACFENVAWISDDGQDYYDALEEALYPTAGLVSISAVFTQGSAVIYDTDSLNTLKQYLVVTAHFDDLSSQTITGYSLSGTLAVGTSTITVSYSGKTTTFNVTVYRIPPEYQEVEYIESTGTQRILLGGLITDLRTDGWSVDTVFQLTDPSATASSSVLCQHENTCQWFGCWNTNVNYGNSTSALSKVSVHTKWTQSGIENTINGMTGTGNFNAQSNTFNLPDFHIFALLMNGSAYKYSKIALYSMKLYKNTELYCDLVPCYRKADGVIGLFDTKHFGFLTNAGTGTFLKGGDVQ